MLSLPPISRVDCIGNIGRLRACRGRGSPEGQFFDVCGTAPFSTCGSWRAASVYQQQAFGFYGTGCQTSDVGRTRAMMQMLRITMQSPTTDPNIHLP